MPIWYAHRLAERLAKVRKDGTLPFLRPDGKTQVTVRYENGMPKSVHTVVIAAQHNPEVKSEDLQRGHHRGSDQKDHPGRTCWWIPSS